MKVQGSAFRGSKVRRQIAMNLASRCWKPELLKFSTLNPEPLNLGTFERETNLLPNSMADDKRSFLKLGAKRFTAI
jgi:hypothetical protein